MAKYAAVSRQVRAIFLSTTPRVEPVSLDEAYLDLSGTEQLHGRSAAATLADIARRVEAEIGITVSIGLSWSRFLAKLASEFGKPRGFGVIGRAEAAAFLAPRPVRVIPGVGPKLEQRLVAAGFRTIGDLQQAPADTLRRRFGSLGLWLAERAFGRGSDAVEPDREAKGVSAETTFDADLVGVEALAKELWPLCERVSERLKKARLAGSSVVLKLKRADFKIVTRRRHLPDPTQRAEQIWQVARRLLEAGAGRAAWRLIGVGVVDIVDDRAADPPDLFSAVAGRADPAVRALKPAIEDAVDAVRAKFGSEAIALGRGLERPRSGGKGRVE
jgi:DNA polymerase-4